MSLDEEHHEWRRVGVDEGREGASRILARQTVPVEERKTVAFTYLAPEADADVVVAASGKLEG